MNRVTCDGLFSREHVSPVCLALLYIYIWHGGATHAAETGRVQPVHGQNLKPSRATFNLAPKAMIGSTGYSSFAEAYTAAAADAPTTIMLLEGYPTGLYCHQQVP